MSRRRDYEKALELNLNSSKVNIYGLKNTNSSADIMSSEVIDFAAKLFYLSSKRGRTSVKDGEVFNEAI